MKGSSETTEGNSPGLNLCMSWPGYEYDWQNSAEDDEMLMRTQFI